LFDGGDDELSAVTQGRRAGVAGGNATLLFGAHTPQGVPPLNSGTQCGRKRASHEGAECGIGGRETDKNSRLAAACWDAL